MRTEPFHGGSCRQGRHHGGSGKKQWNRRQTMKSLGIFAVLAVLTVGVAAAQSSQDMGNMKTSGATFAEGIVDTSSSTSLSIKNEAGGRLSFLLDSHTVNAANHPAGSRVKINYHTNENGVAIADEIQGAGDSGKVATTTSTTTTTQAPLATTYTESTKPAPAPVTESEPVTPAEPAPVAAPADTTVKQPATSEPSNLPKTASHLPAIGLLGLAALAGFAVLRSVR